MTGKMYEDTFTFQQAPNGKVAVEPNLRFGCGMFNSGNFGSNESGIAGFGCGGLFQAPPVLAAFPSPATPDKTSPALPASAAGYCLCRHSSRPSTAFLGTSDNLEAQATGRLQSTPLVRNPESNHYYLLLKGITVGKMRQPFDAAAFALKGDGFGGTIIDSSSSLTSIPEALYRSLVEAFKSQVFFFFWKRRLAPASASERCMRPYY
uniref:Aspartic proteinase nepenthesin-2 n=1 Tax=Aegilops tauschii TaxID=37682 RepID=N1R3J1_AEGTA